MCFQTEALASGGCVEVNWITGVNKFIMFGSCGSLDREKQSKKSQNSA